MKYIRKKTKIIEVPDDYITKKYKYDSYNEAIFAVASKKVSTIINRINKDTIPSLVETQRFINSLPKEQRKMLTSVLAKSLNFSYKQKARKQGNIETTKIVEKI